MTDRSCTGSRLLGRSILASLALILFAGALFAGAAQARDERVRWTHPRTDISGFEIRVRALDGSRENMVDVGLPMASGGIYDTTIDVGDGDVDVSVRAYITGQNISSAWTAPQTRLGPAAPSPLVSPGGGQTIPATPGASARFDFDTNSLGNSVPGWVDTRANYSTSIDDSLFGVVTLDGNRMLRTASPNDSIHSHLTGSGQVRSNFEVRGRMATNHPDAIVGVTTYSAYPSNDAYYRIAGGAGQSIRFEGRPGLSCAAFDSGLVPAAGDWIRFEVDVVDEGNQNRIRAKVWRQGDGEPNSPQINCVDNTAGRPTSGVIGVYASGAGEKFWDDIEVVQGATGGGGSTGGGPPAPPTLIQITPVQQ